MQALKRSLVPLITVAFLLLMAYSVRPNKSERVSPDEGVALILLLNPELRPEVSGRALTAIPSGAVVRMPDGGLWRVNPKGLGYTYQEWRKEQRLAWEFWIANRRFLEAPNVAIAVFDSSLSRFTLTDLRKNSDRSPSAMVRATYQRVEQRYEPMIIKEGVSLRTFVFVCIAFLGALLYLSVVLFYKMRTENLLRRMAEYELRQGYSSYFKLLRLLQAIAASVRCPVWNGQPKQMRD